MKKLIIQILAIVILLLAGCSQLPKGETCNLKGITMGGTSVGFSSKTPFKPTVIMNPNTYCYDCSDGVTYCINRKER